MTQIHAVIGLSFLALSGCGVSIGPGEFRADFKSNDNFWTNMAAPVKGTSPHGTQQTWYSSNVKGMFSGSEFRVPAGTVAIKEFDVKSDGASDGYAVMIKKPAGYDSANNDWYYEMRGLDGTVVSDPAPGKIEMCINCHKMAAKSDFLAATSLR